ncbi:hypothetical protein J2T19_002732 [Paenibacillus tundrae]|uniref:Uncharacterized protein n=1 Tax=Paenibacillus tundrae TaxID=528187 RepID=A0ABT9WDC8_9BACL|nr:hypothetical protein [Paenibacillus tundrae]
MQMVKYKSTMFNMFFLLGYTLPHSHFLIDWTLTSNNSAPVVQFIAWEILSSNC